MMEGRIMVVLLWGLMYLTVPPVHGSTNDTSNSVTVPGNDTEVVQMQGVDLSFSFEPSQIKELVEEHTETVSVNVTLLRVSGVTQGGILDAETLSQSGEDEEKGFVIRVAVEHGKIAELVHPTDNNTTHEDRVLTINVTLPAAQSTTTYTEYITVRGRFLGHTSLNFHVESRRIIPGPNASNPGIITDSNPPLVPQIRYKISVIRPVRFIDNLFIATVTVFVLIANVGMGCKIDLDVVKSVLKRPLAPAIGFVLQFGFMPAIAYGMAKAFNLQGAVAFAVFATGCAPGGGSSNMFTYLLDGDVSLSVTMTLISTIASLAMVPLWLFTLGQSLLKNSVGEAVTIPYANIVISLISMLIPVSIGLLVQRKKPTWAKKIRLILKPLFLIFITYMMTVGIYTNLYLFQLFTPSLMLASCLLPYIGFVLGGMVSIVTCQPLARKIAIAIETGIQNTGLPIILLKYSLPQPDADMSLVSPVSVAMFTPIPLYLIFICYEIYKRIFKKGSFSPVTSHVDPDQPGLSPKSPAERVEEEKTQTEDNGAISTIM